MDFKKFRKVYIEITNRCNRTCSFCPTSNRTPGQMTPGQFNSVLSQIEPFGKFIYLHVKGEPLLHPELPAFLALIREKNFTANITTNGLLLPQRESLLLENPAIRQINLSLHALAELTPGQQENYLTYLEGFIIRAQAHSNLIVSLRFWNYDALDPHSAHQTINTRVFELLEKKLHPPFRISDILIPGMGKLIAGNIYVNCDHQFNWPSLKNQKEETRGYCYGLRNQIAILCDGTVVPCCLDAEGIMDLGNIFTTSLSDILKGERAQEMHRGFTEKRAVEELCRKCDFKGRFKI